MSSLTWSPCSNQLKFNFKLKNSSLMPLLFVRIRVPSFGYGGHRCFRVLCVGKDGAKNENSSSSTSSSQLEESNSSKSNIGTASLSNSDDAALDDWFTNSEQSGDSKFKGFQGLVGLGLASFFLVAGIIFAGMSIAKQKNSRPRQEMLLTSEEELYKEGEDINDEESNVLNERNLRNDSSSIAVKGSENTLIENESKAKDDEFIEPDTKLDANLETEHVSRIDIGISASNSHLEDSELDSSTANGSQQDHPFGGATYGVRFSDDNEDASYVSNASRPTYDLTRENPAPTLLSAALQVPPGKILVPAVTDDIQGQALAALQALKVIESDAQPGQLCTRCEYARWLVSASNSLSRNSISKVYPAMYIENVTELAFDDVMPDDPDFSSIQGLAEAGLISSKLSKRDMLSSPEEDIGSFYFNPNSPLSRQDLVSWKMAVEKRQLPETDSKALQQLSGFIDIDKIDPAAWPALMADLSSVDQGIVPLAFGYTRLFQPDKPVTKGQAAIAVATGEAAYTVSEELTRIEAEAIADEAVSAHNALVAEVEKDINANFEKEILMEREKTEMVQKMAEEATEEVERLKEEREEQNTILMKERAVIESQMEVLAKLRGELEEQLKNLMSNKVEISYEKEKIEKLRRETEEENQAISRLQYELQVERKALSMARTWAEEEAKRVQEHAKVLEENRIRWERRGLKVVVDKDLREETLPANTWVNLGKKLSVEETVGRAKSLTSKLRAMVGQVLGKSKEIINAIIEKIQLLISVMKQWISDNSKRTMELKDVAIDKVGGSLQELQQHAADIGSIAKEQADRVVRKVSGN